MIETYTAHLTFDHWHFSADFTDATSAIVVDGALTPFRVADAQHNPYRAVVLVLKHYGPDYHGGRGLAGDELEEYLDELIFTVE